MKQKQNLTGYVFDIANTIFFFLISLTFIYPILFTLSLSLSSAKDLGQQKIGILPLGFTLQSYQYLLSDGRILRYYLNTVTYALLGTLLMLIVTSMISYALTFKNFSGRKVITVLLLITMFFSGGMIPSYLLMIRLHLIDTLWVMIVPGAIGAWNVMIFKTFFNELPSSFRESAIVDGANNFSVLFRIIIPLSKPLLATFTLFSVVGYWNDFMTAVLYLRSPSKYPIQMLLRKMLVLLDFKDMQYLTLSQILELTSTRTVKSAAVIITITPILFVYPFLQKYFAKGILIGSIKG